MTSAACEPAHAKKPRRAAERIPLALSETTRIAGRISDSSKREPSSATITVGECKRAASEEPSIYDARALVGQRRRHEILSQLLAQLYDFGGGHGRYRGFERSGISRRR